MNPVTPIIESAPFAPLREKHPDAYAQFHDAAGVLDDFKSEADPRYLGIATCLEVIKTSRKAKEISHEFESDFLECLKAYRRMLRIEDDLAHDAQLAVNEAQAA